MKTSFTIPVVFKNGNVTACMLYFLWQRCVGGGLSWSSTIYGQRVSSIHIIGMPRSSNMHAVASMMSLTSAGIGGPQQASTRFTIEACSMLFTERRMSRKSYKACSPASTSMWMISCMSLTICTGKCLLFQGASARHLPSFAIGAFKVLFMEHRLLESLCHWWFNRSS